ncbi:MAG: hypothetical protein WBC18_17760 [Ottowia sp.]|uniref:SDH family Clp fold serine proteinase n=1 Tax=Ottowia sp. TaxID=1898956 RepID=UPI003C719BE5
MGVHERHSLFIQLEKVRQRPLISYITSTRNGAAGAIASDVVGEIVAQLDQLPTSTKELDLLIVSNGGDPTVAWRIVSLIRERVQKFSVLVPQAAFSAATLIALGADEIVMHPHGNLGPTDPQIHAIRPGSTDRTPFGSEDLAAFLKFAREIGITDQAQLLSVFNHFCEEVGSVAVGIAARSAHLGVSMGEKLLQLHMKADGERAKARSISEKLTRDFFHHGYPLSRTEAKSIGLPIADRHLEVEKLMWSIWADFRDDLELRSHASDIEFLRKDPSAAPLFGPILHIASAPDGPAIQQPAPILIPPVSFGRTHAMVESARLRSHFVVRGTLLAARMPDLNFKMSKVVEWQGWDTVPIGGLDNKAKGVESKVRSAARSASTARVASGGPKKPSSFTRKDSK